MKNGAIFHGIGGTRGWLVRGQRCLKRYYKIWREGCIEEVGDLSKLILAKENQRDIQDLDSKLKHELADCLWSVIVLTDAYDVNLEEAFAQTMDDIEEKLKWESQK